MRRSSSVDGFQDAFKGIKWIVLFFAAVATLGAASPLTAGFLVLLSAALWGWDSLPVRDDNERG